MSFRAFVAVEIDELPELRKFSAEVKRTGAPLKMVNLDNLHVTLKFLGDTDEEIVNEIQSVMQDAVSGIRPFNIAVRGSGAFPNLNRISVVWAGMEGAEPLAKIAGKIDAGLENLGFKREKRKFSPHVTIARVKGGRNKELLAQVIENNKTTHFGEIQVNEIILKKSVLTPSGPIYSDIVKIEL